MHKLTKYLNEFIFKKASLYGNVFATPSSEYALVKGSDLNNNPEFTIDLETPMAGSVNLPDCALQLIGLDEFKQITYGLREFSFPSLKKENISLLFEEKSSFPCLMTLIPANYESFKELSDQKHYFALPISEFSDMNITEDKNQLSIGFKLRKCQIGEYFSLDSLKCMPCEANFFSLDSDFIEPSACKSCAQEHFFCYGGFQLSPKPGYWRKHSDIINFIKCPNEKGMILLIFFFIFSIFFINLNHFIF